MKTVGRALPVGGAVPGRTLPRRLRAATHRRGDLSEGCAHPQARFSGRFTACPRAASASPHGAGRSGDGRRRLSARQPLQQLGADGLDELALGREVPGVWTAGRARRAPLGVALTLQALQQLAHLPFVADPCMPADLPIAGARAVRDRAQHAHGAIGQARDRALVDDIHRARSVGRSAPASARSLPVAIAADHCHLHAANLSHVTCLHQPASSARFPVRRATLATAADARDPRWQLGTHAGQRGASPPHAAAPTSSRVQSGQRAFQSRRAAADEGAERRLVRGVPRGSGQATASVLEGRGPLDARSTIRSTEHAESRPPSTRHPPPPR